METCDVLCWIAKTPLRWRYVRNQCCRNRAQRCGSGVVRKEEGGPNGNDDRSPFRIGPARATQQRNARGGNWRRRSHDGRHPTPTIAFVAASTTPGAPYLLAVASEREYTKPQVLVVMSERERESRERTQECVRIDNSSCSTCSINSNKKTTTTRRAHTTHTHIHTQQQQQQDNNKIKNDEHRAGRTPPAGRPPSPFFMIIIIN